MAVLNDFEACGYGVPALQPEDLLVLNDVPARQKVSPELCLLYHVHKVQLHHATRCTKFKAFCAGPVQARQQVSPLQHQRCTERNIFAQRFAQRAKLLESLASSVLNIVPSQHKEKTPAPHHTLKSCTFNSRNC